MSDEPTLAYTVHHKGRKYRAGTTASMIGPTAAEIGEHAWAGGIAPEKAQASEQPGPEQPGPEQGQPNGDTLLGAPPVPAPSALPTGGPAPVPSEGEDDAAAGEPAETPARKPATSRRGGQG